MAFFLNITNHPKEYWSQKQILEAEQYGTILDLPFPQIPASLDEGAIDLLVDQYYQKIMQYDNPTVLLQGEYVFCFRLATKLKQQKIVVLSACTERSATEETDESGDSIKTSEFHFCRFREY